MERLQRADHALSKIKAGTKADLAQLTAQCQALLDRHKVAAYLNVTWIAHTAQTKRYLQRGRHGPDSPYEMVTKTTWQMTVTRLQDEIALHDQLAGWRIYITNAPTERLACFR